MSRAGYTAIIPVKPWALAKSRLDVAPDVRIELARAFALDVLAAVLDATAVERVVVVTAEAELRARLAGAGVTLVLDRPLVVPDSLNEAVSKGRSWAAARRPQAPLVVVPGDLPSLTSEALDEALDLMRGMTRSFVPDASGAGTTLLAANVPGALRAVYGPHSARRHSSAGARAVVDVDPSVRRDVDTTNDLQLARLMGLGPHTTDAVGRAVLRPALAG